MDLSASSNDDLIVETYIESNVAIPIGKVREKSSNLMWYGKWSLGIYLTEAVAVLVPHRFNYNIEQFM